MTLTSCLHSPPCLFSNNNNNNNNNNFEPTSLPAVNSLTSTKRLLSRPLANPEKQPTPQNHDVLGPLVMDKNPLQPQRRYLLLLTLIIFLVLALALAFLATTTTTTFLPLNHTTPHPIPRPNFLPRDCVTCFTRSGQTYCCKDGPPKPVPTALIIGLCVGLGVPLLVIAWYVWCCCCFDASMV